MNTSAGLRAAAVVISAAAAVASVTVGVTAARVLRADRRQRLEQAPQQSGDYLLVLGAQAMAEGPSNELRARLDHAVTRWRAGAAPVICVTGGIDGEVDEAEVMARYLLMQGLPADAVQRVVPGGTTRESMLSMATAAPGATVLAVSSPYHAHRLEAEGRRRGLHVIADCPARTPETDNPEIYSSRLMGEVAANLLYAAPPATIPVARRVVVPVRRGVVWAVSSTGRALRRQGSGAG